MADNDIDIREILEGVHAITDMAEAVSVVARLEGALLVLEPLNAVLMPVVMALNVLHGLEAKFIAYECAGTTYGLVHGALNQGSVDYPSGSYSLENEETVQEKRNRWAEGVAKAEQLLSNGTEGVALKNKLLLYTASNGGDVRKMLDEIWATLCKAHDIENPYSTLMRLLWPETGISGK